MNLIDLSAQEQQLLEALTHISPEGETISEEEQARIIEAYIVADGAFKDKLDRYCWLIEAFSARADFRHTQAARFVTLARLDESVATKMTNRIKAVMASRAEKQIETENFRVRIIGNGGKAPLIVPEEWRRNPASAPERFHRRRIELDLTVLRAAIEAGETVEGCFIGERGTRLALY